MAKNIPNTVMIIVEDLTILRLAAVIAEDLNDPSSSKVLVDSFQGYVNNLMAQVPGEDWTYEEAYEFVFTDILESESPWEAGYILQQRVLAKTSVHPDKFRDPDPLQTVNDVRGQSDAFRESYLNELRQGL